MLLWLDGVPVEVHVVGLLEGGGGGMGEGALEAAQVRGHGGEKAASDACHRRLLHVEYEPLHYLLQPPTA